MLPAMRIAPLLVLLISFACRSIAQVAGLPDPDSRCTLGLCRPIGEVMASCIGGDATPETITWQDLESGGNVTTSGVSMPKRLQCFCESPGMDTRLTNCNACYTATNQEEYWTQGITNIKLRCGFTLSTSISPHLEATNTWLAVVVTLSVVLSSIAHGMEHAISL